MYKQILKIINIFLNLYTNYPNKYIQVGHYLNIINPNYKYTGFAFKTKDNGVEKMLNLAYGQVFETGNPTYTNTENAVSIEDYIDNFNAYYDLLVNGDQNL